jgi:hypothetical protein
MHIHQLIAVAALSLATAPALAQDLRDLSVEQISVAQAGMPRPGSLQLSLSTDRPDATYAIGETVRLVLSADEDAYVTILDVGPSGRVIQLFPNQYQPDNHVYANRPVEVGGGGSGGRITVMGPVGVELIKVIASNRPITVVSEAQLQGSGPFRTIDGGASTILKDLQVTADPIAQSDTRVAMANFTLRTVGVRATAAPALVVVPGQTPIAGVTPLLPVTVPVAPMTMPTQQPFPLLLAADRPAYRIGDKLTLAVTTLQACNLTVLEFTTAGQVRTLFPNPTTPNNAIGASQTVLVAGGPPANAMPVSGPAGTEQVVAICTTDATQVTLGSDRTAAVRDLVVMAARPASATAMASVTFTVQP